MGVIKYSQPTISAADGHLERRKELNVDKEVIEDVGPLQRNSELLPQKF